MTNRLEFWPDYGAESPLWSDGKAVDLESLPLSVDLKHRLSTWNRGYEESKLPINGTGDDEYLQEGKRLLDELRRTLDGHCSVIVHEDWWGEAGLPFDQPT